ncbi:hypothetical protein IMG5_091010 [Ichthyophthirius multifiliis]|uniref:Uncharacterized protein n=1 Tax=Ichthyophthirius multifiliis TaxID=5932 RepID=G0QRA0_ICHMU|nr:hypothetical protein IMG5_091010 [Ichthyophthirius multifiliis]EGR32252.1 hypothetical protein IMG5_091010 [Ichthyophthirius multifiliis]|eukprot:XP_004035738.1 hypothetical protein IMG5_091010 [Ichthyophthirius multifiliis]
MPLMFEMFLLCNSLIKQTQNKSLQQNLNIQKLYKDLKLLLIIKKIEIYNNKLILEKRIPKIIFSKTKIIIYNKILQMMIMKMKKKFFQKIKVKQGLCYILNYLKKGYNKMMFYGYQEPILQKI